MKKRAKRKKRNPRVESDKKRKTKVELEKT